MQKNLRRAAIVGVVVALVAIGSGGGIMADRTAYAAPDTPGSSQDFQGCWGLGSGAGAMGGMMGLGMFLDQVTLDKVAKMVGISTQDLQTRLGEGKSLAELAQGKATEQQLIDIIIAPRKEMMQLSVNQGYLTKDQADRMLKWMETAAKDFVNSKTAFSSGGMMGGFGGMAGMMGGFGGMGGMMGGAGGTGGMMGGYSGKTGGARFN